MKSLKERNDKLSKIENIETIKKEDGNQVLVNTENSDIIFVI